MLQTKRVGCIAWFDFSWLSHTSKNNFNFCKDEFILLATDGLWEKISSTAAVELIRSLRDNSGFHRDAIAVVLAKEALRTGVYDNVTVLIIWLK
jgi:serine/threonine protein phosphatase PrpC